MKSEVLLNELFYKRIYKPIFILPADEHYVNIPFSNFNNYAITIGVNPTTNYNENFTNLLFKSNNQFCLYFDQPIGVFISKTDKNILFERFLLFFLSKNYIHFGKQPIILIKEANLLDTIEFKKSFNRFLQIQGIADILIFQITGESFKKQAYFNNPILSFKDEDLIDDTIMESFFLNPDIIGSYLIFSSKNSAEVFKLEENFHRICSNYLRENSINLKLILKNIEIYEQNVKLTSEILTLIEQVEISNSFVELSKNKYRDDYELLFKFYHNEYETLPIWYKRIGHIVNVLTGNRRFKSLFNNNVKKYKD